MKVFTFCKLLVFLIVLMLCFFMTSCDQAGEVKFPLLDTGTVTNIYKYREYNCAVVVYPQIGGGSATLTIKVPDSVKINQQIKLIGI